MIKSQFVHEILYFYYNKIEILKGSVNHIGGLLSYISTVFFQQWKPLSNSRRLILERNSSLLVELTQSADGAAVGLVAQSVCAGVAETQVSARQDECVSHIRQTHHTLSAVVTDLVVSDLEIKKTFKC